LAPIARFCVGNQLRWDEKKKFEKKIRKKNSSIVNFKGNYGGGGVIRCVLLSWPFWLGKPWVNPYEGGVQV